MPTAAGITNKARDVEYGAAFALAGDFSSAQAG